jgi:hypothetical protein
VNAAVNLTELPDPEPMVRTLYRVRHDLVMVGRPPSDRSRR